MYSFFCQKSFFKSNMYAFELYNSRHRILHLNKTRSHYEMVHENEKRDFKSHIQVGGRVARWYIFKPKIPFRVNFGGSRYGRYWYIFGHLVNFMAIYWIVHIAIWYSCTKKYLATLVYGTSCLESLTSNSRNFGMLKPKAKTCSKRLDKCMHVL
jgi:hypothetical protein